MKLAKYIRALQRNLLYDDHDIHVLLHGAFLVFPAFFHWSSVHTALSLFLSFPWICRLKRMYNKNGVIFSLDAIEKKKQYWSNFT